MTVPAFVWAMEQGRELRLSSLERLVLIVLADRGNGRGYCWPSLTQLMVDTGSTKPSLIAAIRRLASLALIRIERLRKGQGYHILRGDRPVKNPHRSNGAIGKESAPVSVKNPHRSTIHNGKESAPVSAPGPVKNPHPIGKESTPGSVKNPHRETSKRNLKETGARARGGAADASSALASYGPAAATPSSPSGSRPPPSDPPPDEPAPPLAANDAEAVADTRDTAPDATDSGMPPRPPSFEETLAALRAKRAAIPLATPQANTLAAELPNATDLATALSGLARGLAKAWQPAPTPTQRPVPQQLAALRSEPHDPIRSAEQQIAALMATATPTQIARAEAHSHPPMLEAAE